LTLLARAALVLALLLALALLTRVAGQRRWSAASARLARRIASESRTSGVYHKSQLASLPAPVARYLDTVLREGQPYIRTARIRHTGTFRTGTTDDTWRRFESDETFGVQPAAFVWNARVFMSPGAPVCVRDSFIDNRGGMHAAVLGLFTVAKAEGEPELNEAALQRYLAELAWLPTALLPSQGISWETIDDRSARATLTSGPTTATLEFHFADTGEIERVYAPARQRASGKVFQPTPWEGRFSNYEERDGLRIPTDAEVAWYLDGARTPYWRGRVEDAAFVASP